MTFLIDANVLSEPTKSAPNGKVVEWLTVNERSLVVDSIVLGEVYVGVLALPRGRKRSNLERWFESLVQTIDCFAWDAAIARRWAALVVHLRQKGQTLPLLDGMIAATALQHDLTMATRNTRDFKKAGMKVMDPFA